jgi:hemerythrin
VDQVLLFDLDVILASEGLAQDMHHFLRGWLTNHILVVDKKFASEPVG